MCYELTIRPRDVLFFRDARPMGGSYEGAGANWPLPTTFHAAVQSALYREWPAPMPEWESKHASWTDKEIKLGRDKTTRARFGGLKTWGPFPWRDGQMYFPSPADVAPTETLAPVKTPDGSESNLPPPLKYVVGGKAGPSKRTVHAFVSGHEMARYLSGDQGVRTTPASELYVTETRPGVEIDPETGTHAAGKFFQAKYVRLHDELDVRMIGFAECVARKASGVETDLLAKLFEDRPQMSIVFGGQQGMAWVNAQRNESACPFWREQTQPPATRRIKWVLLAPAVFNAGWRPDWVDADGRVRLRNAPERGEFGSREEWRKAINAAGDIAASLVAACIPGSLAFSGWHRNPDVENPEKEIGPKRTLLAVPAGSVYYFEADDAAAAKALVTQLHGRTKSAWYGEQGFGLGVCGKWNP